MVNKVRKKDGGLKQPYQYILPFTKVFEMKDRIKPLVAYVYDDKKCYGTLVWGRATSFIMLDKVEEVIKEYIPNYKPYERRDGYYNFGFYIAYSEFDKEV